MSTLDEEDDGHRTTKEISSWADDLIELSLDKKALRKDSWAILHDLEAIMLECTGQICARLESIEMSLRKTP